MRLPTLDKKPMSGQIDRKEAMRIVLHAVEQGVNYIDTAYPYHNGKSERLLGTILKECGRDRALVATKCPVWLIEKPSDFDLYLDRQLRRLRIDSIDYYLFHGLNRKRWDDVVVKHRLLERARAATRKGKISHLGFSFHDGFDSFKHIIDATDDWALCQIQYNYMDTENQAGTKGLRYAASKGLGVVVMEPLLGGRLASPPPAIRKMLKGSRDRAAPWELALQWVWDQREVSTVLSGMSTMAQVKGNLRAADRSGVGSLTKARHLLIKRIREEYSHLRPIPCTRCGYCMPCPNGVDIPRNFEEYIDGFVHNDPGTARYEYERFFTIRQRAGSCKACRKCEAKCPQRIRISEMMPKVHAVLGCASPYPKSGV